MKATIKYDAPSAGPYWKQSTKDPSKKACNVVVEANGKQYDMYAVEGSPLWTMPAGAEVNIEITAEPTDGRRGSARLQGSNKGWQRRGFVKPTNEEAAGACDYMKTLFAAVKGRFPDMDNETVARLTASIFSKIC